MSINIELRQAMGTPKPGGCTRVAIATATTEGTLAAGKRYLVTASQDCYLRMDTSAADSEDLPIWQGAYLVLCASSDSKVNVIRDSADGYIYFQEMIDIQKA